MARSTSAKPCPICGTWVSTDAPRTSFSGSTELARDIVWEKFGVHMQTYHPDYLAWSRRCQAVGAGLFISCLLILLAWVDLKNLLLLPLAIAAPLGIGIPFLLAYRRKFADAKQAWAEAHPAGLSTSLPGAQSSFNRCPICGETLSLERGFSVELRAHYESKHAEIYRWQKRVKLVIGLAGIASLIFILLTARFGQTFTLLSILGMFLLFFFIAFYGDRRQKQLKRSWQEQHETQASS